MATVSEDTMDSNTAPQSLVEQKQQATLMTESPSHITTATGYEHEYYFDPMHTEAAARDMISNGSHSYLPNNEQKSLVFDAESTDSCLANLTKITDRVCSTGYCSETISHIQELRDVTNSQPAFTSQGHNDVTSMEVEQGFDQRDTELHQEAEQMLNPEAYTILDQEATHGLHMEPTQGLHPEPTQGLHLEPTQGLHPEPTQGLHPEPTQGLHPEPTQGLHQETKLSEVHDTLPTARISETKPTFDCSSFIGPVIPSGYQLQSQGVCEDVSPTEDDTDVIMAPHGPTRTNVPSDVRYNLTLGSVPRLAASTSWEFQQIEENFLRGCKWSPDGSCVLTNSNDNCLRIFSSCNETGTSKLMDNKQMVSTMKMKECSLVYDFAWHPKMNLSQSDHCRVVCTCSGIPIHLWDATTGQIIANYRAYDQFDEITAAYSLSFSLDGRRIYAGYNKAIRIFDTDYPVRSCKTVKTYNSQQKDGQTGIISSFAFSPDENGLYVAGSYSRHIGMYDSACDKLVCLMQGQHGGVTHLMFSPDATKLYSGGRKDAEILCWDMRKMDKLLFSALRDVKTNQRMYFDLSHSGRYLVSGNNDGTVAFWDTLSPTEEVNGDAFLKPCSQFQAHGDCVNGVSFNHHKNMLATASGQRHFQNFDYDSSDSADDEHMQQADTPDFSLRLWQIPLLS